MLKNISKIISPELLKTLCEMGHGDEIVIADGNFPAASIANKLIRADGISGTEILNAVLSVFPLDQYDNENFILMERCPQDTFEVTIWDDYKKILNNYEPENKITYLNRFDYYERAKKAYAVIATGEEKQYANIILKKGCVLK